MAGLKPTSRVLPSNRTLRLDEHHTPTNRPSNVHQDEIRVLMPLRHHLHLNRHHTFPRPAPHTIKEYPVSRPLRPPTHPSFESNKLHHLEQSSHKPHTQWKKLQAGQQSACCVLASETPWRRNHSRSPQALKFRRKKIHYMTSIRCQEAGIASTQREDHLKAVPWSHNLRPRNLRTNITVQLRRHKEMEGQVAST